MPDVELGINDMWRQGKEVVGRHDIIPVVTEEWIRLENVEFHSCVQQDEYEKSRIIKYVRVSHFPIIKPINTISRRQITNNLSNDLLLAISTIAAVRIIRRNLFTMIEIL